MALVKISLKLCLCCSYLESQSALFFQKYDPRADYFDDLILLMFECGIEDYLTRRTVPHRDMKESIEYKEERLTLEHFYLMYIVGMAGMVLACLAFIAEMRTSFLELSCLNLLPRDGTSTKNSSSDKLEFWKFKPSFVRMSEFSIFFLKKNTVYFFSFFEKSL